MRDIVILATVLLLAVGCGSPPRTAQTLPPPADDTPVAEPPDVERPGGDTPIAGRPVGRQPADLVGPGWLATAYSVRNPGIDKVVTVEPTLAFDWAAGSPHHTLPKDHFGIRFDGIVTMPQTGLVTFTIESDGGFQLWADDQLISEHWPIWGEDAWQAQIPVEQGQAVALRLTYHDAGGSSHLALKWSWGEQEALPIPAAMVMPAAREAPRLAHVVTSNPAILEGVAAEPEAFSLSIGDQSLAVTWVGNDHWIASVAFTDEPSLELQMTDGDRQGVEVIRWAASDLDAGESCLVAAGAQRRWVAPEDGVLTVRSATGVVDRILELAQGGAVALQHAPGTWYLEWVGGERKSLTTVTAVAVDWPSLVRAQVGGLRPVPVTLSPSSAAVTWDASDAITIGRTQMEGAEPVLAMHVDRAESSGLIVRDNAGGILSYVPVASFVLEEPARQRVHVNEGNHRAYTSLALSPSVPGLEIRLSTEGRDASFADGTRTRRVTSAGTGTREEIPLLLEVPEGEYPPRLCYGIEIYEWYGEGENGSWIEIPLCFPPWYPTNACYVLGYNSLVFSQEADKQEGQTGEDEVFPGYVTEADAEAAIRDCWYPPLRPVDNHEPWQSGWRNQGGGAAFQTWSVKSQGRPGGGGGGEDPNAAPGLYRLAVSDPEPLTIPLSNPEPATFAGSKESACKECQPVCDSVTPPMRSGTIPGLYTTTAVPCSDDSSGGGGGGGAASGTGDGSTSSGGGSGTSIATGGDGGGESPPIGLFLVSKLDAHGPGTTTTKFPDHAEVLPKRSGYLMAPVIQMDRGGDGMVDGCSLYGVVCDGTNEWQFTAIAVHPGSGENLPPPYRLEWHGLPGFTEVAVPGQRPGAQITVAGTLPSGRHLPTLKIFGPPIDDPNGAEALLGVAAIHSIGVEERQTCNVGEKTSDVSNVVGTAFQTTNHIGQAMPTPVDLMASITGTPHPHPQFDVRGRVSLDGYPQNEYWVTAEDSGDLPQVVTAPAHNPQTYYLQGYGAPSVHIDDLTLALAGQAQIEACASDLYFLDCTPCGGTPPPRYPVTVEWMPTDTETFSSSLPLEVVVGEPDLKHQPERRDPFAVQADFVAEDPGGAGTDDGYHVDNGYRSRINFQANVPWSFWEVDPFYFPKQDPEQSIKVVWRASARINRDGGANHCQHPRLRDLLDQTMEEDPDGRIEARLIGLQSQMQLSYDADDRRVKAGDRFYFVAHSLQAHSSQGRRFWDRRTLETTPGDKVFHIVQPNDPSPVQRQEIAHFDPTAMFAYDDGDFAASPYKDWKWKAPIESEARDTLKVWFFDRFRNPLQRGTAVTWSLFGGGRLGSFDPTANDLDGARNARDIVTTLGSDGSTEIAFTQNRYPHCPWQYTQRPDPSAVHAMVDGVALNVTYSAVTTDQPLPSAFPPLRLDVSWQGNGTLDPTNPRIQLLDIARGQGGRVTARLTRGGVGIEDVPIAFTCSNGTLHGSLGNVVRTDGLGHAEIQLTAEGARLTDEGFGAITITASVSDVFGIISSYPTATTGTVLRGGHPRWIDSRPMTIHVEHPILARNAFGDTFFDVETLVDEGEMLAPQAQGLGGQEGDWQRRIPIFDRTRVVVRGPANHPVKIDLGLPGTLITGQPSPIGASARYPLDAITTVDVTPNIFGGHDASVPASVFTVDAKQGVGAAAFTGTETLTIPDAPFIDERVGLACRFWLAPQRLGPCTILERPGHYRLDLLASGHLELVVPGQLTPLRSDITVANQRWNEVELRITAGNLKLGIARPAEPMDAVFAPGPGSWPVSGGDLVMATGYVGRIDDLRFEAGGQAVPQQFQVTGLAPGGTLITDANGRAEFTIQITSEDTRDNHLPRSYTITAYGSTEARAELHDLPKEIIGNLVNCAVARIGGPDQPGRSEHWYSISLDTVVEWIPIVGDSRELLREIYKGATGCDDVSWLNVTFSAVGLVADIATFGTAGLAVKAAKTTLKAVSKQFLKDIAVAGISSKAFAGAIEGFVQLTTVEVTQADKVGRQPRDWVVTGQACLAEMQRLFSGGMRDLLTEAYQGTEDVFVGVTYFTQVGKDAFVETFDDLEVIEDFLTNSMTMNESTNGGQPVMLVGGGAFGLMGQRGLHLYQLVVGPSPRFPLGRLEAQPEYTSAVFKALSSMLPDLGISKQDTKAMRGLREITMLAIKGAYKGEPSKVIADRIKGALDMVDPGSHKDLLERFSDIWHHAKMTDPAMMKDVQDIARSFAARGDSPQVAWPQVRGQALVIVRVSDYIRNGGRRLSGGDAIEPRAFDRRLFRDLLVDLADTYGRKMYEELKHYDNLGASIHRLAAQLRSHPGRLSTFDIASTYGIVVVYTGQQLTKKQQNIARGGLIAGIIGNFSFDLTPTQMKAWRQEVVGWAHEFLDFEHVSMPITMRPPP